MFGSLMTAMVTPFDDEGKLDLSQVPKLIDHLLTTGTTALVVAGTTGESPTLTHDEKLALFDACVSYAKGKIPVIAGTGSFSTADTIALSKEAQALGVDGLLLVVPYYNRPSQEGLYQHFRAVANQVQKPILLYNIPARTGSNLHVDTLCRLAEIDTIVGVKESSGDFAQINAFITKTPNDFLIYSGDDKFALPTIALGGAGLVSVASHLVGYELSSMISAITTGNLQAAQSIQERLLPIFDVLFCTSNPVMVKAALSMIDLPVGGVRLPLVQATSEELRRLRTILQQIMPLKVVD